MKHPAGVILLTAAAMVGLVLPAAPIAAQTSEVRDSAALQHGRALTRLLFEGRGDTIAAMMTAPFLEAVGGTNGIRAFAASLGAQLGAEAGVETETTVEIGGTTSYDRIARFANVPGGTVTIHWSWRDEGIVAVSVRPTPAPAPSPYLDHAPEVALRLPFQEEWTVVWGGRVPHRNYHVVVPGQRFALDLLVVRDGATHVGDGRSNEDYHCWGRPILAPAPGQVIAAIDTLPDNLPGATTVAAPAGNHVMIDHGNDEYSLLGHLQSGSVRVAEGQAVAAGDTVGACGNSGNTSEPHLHFHLQDEPGFGAGQGLPVFFNDYISNGEAVRRGEPVRGDNVRPGA